MALNKLPEEQHNIEIHENFKSWQKKATLQKIYLEFYKSIAVQINTGISGKIVELGSGIGNMKMVVPEVICTDIFNNPWIDQVENAYKLSFENKSVSNIILFDVFHHLKYPGTALNEFRRVLNENGRIIIFEPAMSAFGFLVYGLLHHEPVQMFKKISWFAEKDSDLNTKEYYAAQGNASRIFGTSHYKNLLNDWNIVTIKKRSSLAYVLSGGYSKPQLYPDFLFPFIELIDKVLSYIPFVFAVRMLVVIEKKKS